jgi:hypothetical protein
MGRLVATWTRETTSGEEFRLVISQPQAAEYIQPPMFEISVAVQMTVKALCLKGDQGEATGSMTGPS